MTANLGKDFKRQVLARRWTECVPAGHRYFAQAINVRKQSVSVPAVGSMVEGLGPFSVKPAARSPLYPVSEQSFELLLRSATHPAEIEISEAFIWGGSRKVVVWKA